MPLRALLLVNRNARRGQADLSKAIAQLREFGFDLVEAPSSDPHTLSDVIRRHAKQVDLVIVGGGDGTLNGAIDGLLETQLPLGILPLGTANDLARTLGIPTPLSDACKVITDGHSERIDLGWVNGKHFFNVASLGLSVKITQQLSHEIKRQWGILAYAIAACQAVLKSVPFTAEIRANGESIKVRTVQIAIGNGRYYGGGLKIAADAAIDDQKLDLYSLEIEHWWQMIALLPNMRSGTHSSWSFVRSISSQSIELSTYRHHSINTDGEITSSTPAHFRVIPKALAVLVPQAEDKS